MKRPLIWLDLDDLWNKIRIDPGICNGLFIIRPAGSNKACIMYGIFFGGYLQKRSMWGSVAVGDTLQKNIGMDDAVWWWYSILL